MLGAGKYDEPLTKALELAGGEQGILLVLDGDKGPGFSAHLDLWTSEMTPKMLRIIADAIERDMSITGE